MKIIDLIVLFIIYVFWFYKKWKSKGKYTLFINTIFYIYFVGVLYFTLMPIITSLPFIFNHGYKSMNMILFDDFINKRGDYLLQIILNIILFVPFGVLYPLMKRKKNMFLRTMFCSFVFSLSIEVLQPLINSRSSDITDLITNVFGALIGYVFYMIIRVFVKKTGALSV